MNQFTYRQADVTHLMSQLRIKVRPKYRKMSQPEGLEGRLNMMRKTVTALFKYERLELSYPKADEARGYAERLISEAIRHGDSHQSTMEMANYWILEKQLVHKLFKVLAPRFENFQCAYTSLYKAPLNYPRFHTARSILELKGNPFPPLIFDGSRNRNLIHNVLLDEARKDHNKAKREEIAKKVTLAEKEHKKLSEAGGINETMSQAAQEISESEQLLKCVESSDTSEQQKSDENTSRSDSEYGDGTVPVV